MMRIFLFLVVILEGLSFELSEDWGEAKVIFQAPMDELDDQKYVCVREPVVVKTNSGRMVVGVQAGNRHSWPERSGQDLVVRYSDDGGRTWSESIVAAEAGDFSCQCHGLVYDAEIKRIFFLYTTYNWDYRAVGRGRGANATGPIYEKLEKDGKPFVTSFRVYSDDEGATWGEPEDITDMVGRQAHFGASEGRQLTVGENKGRLLLPGSRMDLNENGVIVRKYPGVWLSDDHGQTWKLSKIPVPAEIDTPRNLSSEARVSELKGGTLIYNERTRNTGRQLSWSSNGGESWSELTHAGDLQVTQCNGSLLTLRRKDGELTDVLLFSAPSVGGRTNGLVHVSKDGGKMWPIVKKVVKGNFAYSALVQLEGGKVGLFYETGQYRTIAFLRLDLAMLVSE
jgi:sialidase-1